jgi:hypothetical protein
MTHLITPCPDCEDGIRWISKLGGNDPVVSPRACEYCEGTGEKTLFCEGFGCDADAAEFFQGYAWCSACLVEQKQDALWVGE